MAVAWSIVYADMQNLGYGTATYTSPSQTWSAGYAVVYIFFGDANAYGVPIQPMTIKGVTGTLLAQNADGSGSWWGATVTAGSGTVVATSSVAFNNVGTRGGVLTGANTTPTQTNAFYGSLAITTADPQTTPSLTVPSGGIGIVSIGGPVSHTIALPTTWSNATDDGATGQAFITTAAAMTGGTTPTTGTIGATGASGNGWGFAGSNIMALAFGPAASGISAWPYRM